MQKLLNDVPLSEREIPSELIDIIDLVDELDSMPANIRKAKEWKKLRNDCACKANELARHRIIKKSMSFESPVYDKCLEKLGWYKFEDHPIYYSHTIDEEYPYIIAFNTDYEGWQEIYERMVTKGDITEDELLEILRTGFTTITANHPVKEIKYEYLLMLTADFYWHNPDKKLHEIYRNKYERLTRQKYSA